jgi:3-oxoacyl-[acyl-carrier-protein] synthase-3
LISFTVKAVPKLVDRILSAAGLTRNEVDVYLLHQATYKLIDQLRRRLGLEEDRVPIVLKHCGNTVSSTIPIVIDHLRRDSRLQAGALSMLVGFGVGWSWAGCLWRETWPQTP